MAANILILFWIFNWGCKHFHFILQTSLQSKRGVLISVPVGEYSTGVANIFILFYKLAYRANVVSSFLYLLGNIQLGSQTFLLYKLAYWEVQVQLLLPLTFAQHRLSPLAVFTSSACFLHNGRGDNKFVKFTVPTLKAFLQVCCQNVSGNKQ